MPASLGPYTFMGWTPESAVQLAQRVTRDSTRPGVAGHDKIDVGVRGEPFTMTGLVDCVTALDVALTKVQLADLVGTAVQVTDNLGNVWNTVYVDAFRSVREQRMALGLGGQNNGAYLLTFEVRLQPLAVSY